MAYLTAATHGIHTHAPFMEGLAARTLGVIHTIGAWRARRRAEAVLSSLPMDLRKDIGWPSLDRARCTRR